MKFNAMCALIGILLLFNISTSSFSDDTITLTPKKCSDGKWWGYVDGNGCYKIAPQYETASNFTEGLAIVSLYKKFWYIDAQGNAVTFPEYDGARCFSEGLAAVMIYDQKKEKKWGYIDKTGKFVVFPRFDEVSDFSRGLAAVLVDGKKYMIDISGNYINPK